MQYIWRDSFFRMCIICDFTHVPIKYKMEIYNKKKNALMKKTGYKKTWIQLKKKKAAVTSLEDGLWP